MKAIISQLKLIFTTGYPSAYIPTKYWDWKWNSKGNVEYNNFTTLINYIFNDTNNDVGLQQEPEEMINQPLSKQDKINLILIVMLTILMLIIDQKF